MRTLRNVFSFSTLCPNPIRASPNLICRCQVSILSEKQTEMKVDVHRLVVPRSRMRCLHFHASYTSSPCGITTQENVASGNFPARVRHLWTEASPGTLQIVRGGGGFFPGPEPSWAWSWLVIWRLSPECLRYYLHALLSRSIYSVSITDHVNSRGDPSYLYDY
jgi:hypothetical protein